ncbi:putative membrane protein YeaQ/YmgE (transglycosylase-associated protein family) [Sinorhizobium fredii]
MEIMGPKPPFRIMPEAASRDHRPVLRHLVMTALSGVLAGAIAAGALMMLDVGSVGTLVARSTDPLRAAATVVVPFALIGAAAGAAIGLLPYLRKLRR